MDADPVSLLAFLGILCVLLHMRKCTCITPPISAHVQVYWLFSALFSHSIAGMHMYKPPPFFGL